MKNLIGIAALAAVILAAPFVAPAADKAADPVPKAETKTDKKAPGLPFNGTISAVDKLAKTVTLGETNKTRVFVITSETKIYKTVENTKKPATLEDVVVGDRVGGYARKNAEGKQEVVTLNTGLAARNAKAKPADKKTVN